MSSHDVTVVDSMLVTWYDSRLEYIKTYILCEKEKILSLG